MHYILLGPSEYTGARTPCYGTTKALPSLLQTGKVSRESHLGNREQYAPHEHQCWEPMPCGSLARQ